MVSITQNPPIDWAPGRTENGRFAPGQGGRPKGATNKIRRASLHALQDMQETVFLKLREAVEGGDVRAILFCAERLLPTGFNVVELDGATAQDVESAVVSGSISISEAKELASALIALRKISEISEISERLESLEKILQG